MPNIKAICFVVSDKSIVSCFTYINLCKTFGHYWPKGYNLNTLGRGTLGEARY